MFQTVQIETGRSIRFENVASFRKIMKQTEIQQEVEKFIKVIKESGAVKMGPMISATFSVNEVQGAQLMDTEFLIPIDRMIDLSGFYVFKPIFHLVHAVYTRYSGDPHLIQQRYVELTEFINNNQFQQITAAYNININDDKIALGEQPVIDIYIGVNPSIL